MLFKIGGYGIGTVDSYTIISSDSHVIEPPSLWIDRIDSEFLDRAPRLVEEKDGDWWYVDGQRTDSLGENIQADLRFTDPEAMSIVDRFSNVRPGGYIPDEFAKDLEIDGIAGAVVYPSVVSVWTVNDSAFLSAMFQAYNDWLAEFCQAHPDEIKGIAMVNLDDVRKGVEELQRSHRMGLSGAMITVYPPEDRPYDRPEYEPLWATAEELQIPLSLHSFTNHGGPVADTVKATAMTVIDHWVRVSLADMIFSGVFERFPRLRVVAVEQGLAWAPYFIEQLDFAYTQRPQREDWVRFQSDLVPSDFFHRNVFLSFQDDRTGIRERDIIGVDCLTWGSDYPHAEGTFPRSRQVLGEILAGVPDDEVRKIAGENAARLYGFNDS